MSVVDFRGEVRGPDDGAIVEAVQSCLGEVNLDSVTKKQGMCGLGTVQAFSTDNDYSAGIG